MKKVLILYAHPRPERSQVNSAMIRAAQEVSGVTIVDLYAEYPTFDIDIDREQKRLVANDIIVFQHPVYWYSCPALLKEWQDMVLEHGFAYGSKGLALKGKALINAISCGGRKGSYCIDGMNCLTIKELFAPFETMANLCKMEFLSPFIIYGAGHATEENRLDKHIQDYRKLLTLLTQDKLDFEKTKIHQEVNPVLDKVNWEG